MSRETKKRFAKIAIAAVSIAVYFILFWSYALWKTGGG